MILEMTYSDGHHECFDSNSLTGGAVFGRANILTEFDVVWEEGEDGQHLGRLRAPYGGIGTERRRGVGECRPNPRPRLKLIDSSEVPDIESVSLDGRLLTWSQGGCLVDAAKFELACMKWYFRPHGRRRQRQGRRAVQVPGAGPPRALPATRPRYARCSATLSPPSGRPRTRRWPRQAARIAGREVSMKWIKRAIVAAGAFPVWLFRAVFRWFM